MKIMYLTESMGWSGGAAQLLQMAGALQKKGHDVVLGCQPESDIIERAQSAGLTVEPLRMRQDYDVPAAWELSKIIARRKTEILHAHHPTAHAIMLLSSLFSSRAKRVVTRRVMFPICTNPFSRLKYHSQRINMYVAVSEAVKSILVGSGISPKRVDVIPDVIDGKTATREQGLELRTELGIPSTATVIGTIANYSAYKGHDYFIEAAALVLQQQPSYHFLLAGRDTEKLQPLVDRLGIGHSIHLMGFRSDPPRVMAALDMFVMPSLQEAAGTALRDAMYAGLFCIGTRVGGIPESIESGVSGWLVPPANPEALSKAILDMVGDANRAKTIAQCGQTRSAERFSISSALAQTETLYSRLLSQ